MNQLLRACALCLVATFAHAQTVPNPPPVSAAAWILLDAETGQVIAEHNADERREPASITKVMTAYIAFDEIRKGHASLDDEVLISEAAWRQGIDSTQSRMFIEVGKRVRFEDLLRGMIIQSGNDASVAIAEHLAGSKGGFAGLMNTEAKRLGMENSAFTNASGMPEEGHYSTARDIATLVRALIRDFPDHYGMYAEKEFTFNNIRQFNRNRLLWRDASVDGVKTGHTRAAGYCLASSAVRDGRRLISVVLGAPDETRRAQDSLALLNYGFRFFDTVTLYTAGQSLQNLRVYGGRDNEVALGVESVVAATVPRGARERISVAADIRQPVAAPVTKGDILGTLNISLDDQLIASHPLVALADVEEGGFFTRLIDAIRLRFAD